MTLAESSSGTNCLVSRPEELHPARKSYHRNWEADDRQGDGAGTSANVLALFRVRDGSPPGRRSLVLPSRQSPARRGRSIRDGACFCTAAFERLENAQKPSCKRHCMPRSCGARSRVLRQHVQSSMSRMQGSPAPPLQASSYSRTVQVLPTPAPKTQGIGGGNICHVQRRSMFSAARGPAYTRSRQTPPVTFFRRGYTLGYIGGLSDV